MPDDQLVGFLVERLEDDDVGALNVLGCRVDILGTNCDQCVSMVQCCFTSTKTIRLIRRGSPGRPPRLSHSSGTLRLEAGARGIYWTAAVRPVGPVKSLLGVVVLLSPCGTGCCPPRLSARR